MRRSRLSNGVPTLQTQSNKKRYLGGPQPEKFEIYVYQFKVNQGPGVVVYFCNPSTQEAEAGGSQSQGRLDHIVRLCLNNSDKKLNRK
jgi:hypothetical protein